VKITAVRVFRLEGRPRSGLALYQIARGGRAPNEVSPHRWTFTEIETDEGLTGLTHGGSADVKARAVTEPRPGQPAVGLSLITVQIIVRPEVG
jgi:hypothetical protein